MSYIVHIGKLVVALCACFVLALFGAVFAAISFWIPAVICFLLGLIYAASFLMNASVVCVSDKHVERRVFGICRSRLTWEQIEEVGVVGTKVLNQHNPKRVGGKYIYFSPRRMTEEDRFDMCLEWPPKDVIYMQFKQERIQSVQKFWHDKLTLYNVGSLSF